MVILDEKNFERICVDFKRLESITIPNFTSNFEEINITVRLTKSPYVGKIIAAKVFVL